MKPFRDLQWMAQPHPVSGMPVPDEGGYFKLGKLRIVASWAPWSGWDHVSVSLPDRCPTWDEMERVKRAFFHPHEAAMQLHVPVSDHVNLHPYCLHIWRPHYMPIPMPPGIFVGPPSVQIETIPTPPDMEFTCSICGERYFPPDTRCGCPSG